MPIHMQEFYASSNGDRWSLGWRQETSRLFVLHEANAASGGHVTDYGIDDFMVRDKGSAQHDALLRFLSVMLSR